MKRRQESRVAVGQSLPKEVYDEEDDEPTPGHRRRAVRARARSILAGPAITMIVLASATLGLYCVFIMLRVLIFVVNPQFALKGWGGRQINSIAYLIGNLLGHTVAIFWATTLLVCAFNMKNLKGYGYAVTAAITAMLPCSICCLVGLPIGIWALVAINNEDVKRAFGRD